MTEWEDGINRYVFNLNGSEACVLYYDKEYGYYARSYLDSGAREERFPANNLESAKSAAEKWYAELLKRASMCISVVSPPEKKSGSFGGTSMISHEFTTTWMVIELEEEEDA